jgi:REP element-mobilizing transposase RayT
MPRIARMLRPDVQTIYHVMSRTALDGFPIKDVEKDYLVGLIKQLSRLYLTEIIGYCIMGNHFHLLVKMLPESNFSNDEIKQRFGTFFGEKRFLSDEQIPFFRKKYSSLSEFIKEIKMGFSRFYNRRHNRRGFFWGDRFKSMIVEKGETLINCLAYIDLNPVRAELVKKPEDYRWCSLGYHVQTNNKNDFLSLDFGLKEFGELDANERFRRYRRFVYETGGVHSGKGAPIATETITKERKRNFKISRSNRFKQRTRYFTDSGIIGSKEFVRKNFIRFKHLFQTKKDRLPIRVNGLNGMYSLKRLLDG